MEVKKGFQFLETRRDVLFLVVKAQKKFASRIFSPTHQLGFGKNHNPCLQHANNDHSNRRMFAKKKDLSKKIKILLFLCTLGYQNHPWCMMG